MKNVRREEKAIKDLLYEQLIKREHWLRDLKQNLETSIQNAPSGNLKIINCRGIEQYYLDSAETRASYPNGKYLRKSDFELVGKLAQRNYDEKLLSEVEKQLKNIQNIIKKYEKQEIVQVEELYSVYDRMSPSRKKMVDSRIMSDKEYVNQWSAQIYSGKDFEEGQAEIYTEKKERVRSMSYKPKGIGNDISGFYMPAVNRSKNDFMGAFGNDDRSDLLSESYEKNRHLRQKWVYTR